MGTGPERAGSGLGSGLDQPLLAAACQQGHPTESESKDKDPTPSYECHLSLAPLSGSVQGPKGPFPWTLSHVDRGWGQGGLGKGQQGRSG